MLKQPQILERKERLMPGTLVYVAGGALVRRFRSEEEHWTSGLQCAMVIQQSHQWHEPGLHDQTEAAQLQPDYLVLFSADNKMYLVPGVFLLYPDEAKDPGRVFGRLSG